MELDLFQSRQQMLETAIKPLFIESRSTKLIGVCTIMEKINGQTAKIGAVLDTTSNVQPI